MSLRRWAGIHTAPAPLSGFSIGRGSQWTFVCQVAAVTSAHAPGTATPEWFEITEGVIDVEWSRGDAALESRLPVGSASIRVRRSFLQPDSSLGDPMSVRVATNDRFGAGCLVRFGYQHPTLGWRCQFTGFIDTVTQEWSADQRRTDPDGNTGGVLELECYDTFYYLAGYRLASTYGQVSNTTLTTAIDALLSACDWPFDYNYWGTVNDSGIEAEMPQDPLQLLHRVADSGSASAFSDRDGYCRVAGWAYRSGGLSQNVAKWYAVDENIAVPAPVSSPARSSAQLVLPTAIRWVNSMDRLLWRAAVSNPNVAGVTNGVAISPPLSARYQQRRDRPGWPKNDLLYLTHPPSSINSDAAAERSREVTRPDAITFDSQTAGRSPQATSDDLMDFMTDYSELHRSYQVQRRSSSWYGWFDQFCTVGSIQGRISIEGGQHRFVVTHGLRWFYP